MRLFWILMIVAVAAGAFFVTSKYTQRKAATTQAATTQPDTVQVIVDAPNPGSQVSAQEIPRVEVVVARQPMPVGSIVKAEHLDRQGWPKNIADQLPGLMLIDDKNPSPEQSILGFVVRSQFEPGEPIKRNKLAAPDDPNYLAGTIKAGFRAVTITVNNISAVAGFVYPGDHVDVIISNQLRPNEMKELEGTTLLNSDDEDNEPAPLDLTEVLISNVRILALDQRVTTEGQAVPVVPAAVTLEVSPRDAQRIRLSERRGAMLSLALRAYADADSTYIPRPTLPSDLTRLLPPPQVPVLFTEQTDSEPEVVKLNSTGSIREQMMAYFNLPVRGGAQQSVPGEKPTAAVSKPGNPSLSRITIYRGSKEETVGVRQ